MQMDRLHFFSFTESKDSLLEKLESLKSGELDEYKREALRLFGGRRFPNWNEGKLVEMLFYDNLNEKEKKEEETYYYKASVLGFLNAIHMALNDNFLSNELVNRPVVKKDLLVTNWYNLIRGLLKDAIWLLEMFEHKRKLVPDTQYTFQPDIIHHFDLYKEMSHVLFAERPFPRNITLYVGLLRQMIELRLRHAVGILGRIDVATGAFLPVPMGLIFDVLSKHALQSKIEFAVPLEHIQRIYKWSNVHIHTGLKDFSWKYLIAYRYLWTLMLGKRMDGLKSPDYGIETDQETLEEIQKAVMERLEEGRTDLQSRTRPTTSSYKLWPKPFSPHVRIKPPSRTSELT